MATENNIIRKGILSLLITFLILTGPFSFPKPAYAARTVLPDTIYYHLDMGIQVTYEGIEWESRGFDYGDTETITSTVGFGSNVEVLDAYPLCSSKGSSFDFGGDTSSTNIPSALKKEAGNAAYAYDQFYQDYTSTSMSASGTPSACGNEVTFSYHAELETPSPLDVVSYGYNEYDEEIWKLFGGIDSVYDADVKAAIENALLQGRNNTANGNKLYLVFCPTVIKYKKYITVGDLDASLMLPSSAKQGESYTASDNSYIDNSLTVDNAVLEKNEGDGVWTTVIVWEGTGSAGENTSGRIEETSDEIGTITYRLTVTSTDGQTDTDVKTINITDGREINFEADLTLPAYTYEGHTELAQDQSTFEVDGIAYSATRAYAEDIARNTFQCSSSNVNIDKLTDTKANATFYKTGTYNVILTVKAATGGTDTDTETIEVRKTPYIIDNLSGFQKQNRKQTLTATVATYPGKPLTVYSITLKDKVTGNSVALTPDDPQENNSTIKTRSITMTQDVEKGFAYITVEFLTKTPSYAATGSDSQQFYYEINVEDAKGDTDAASKTFAVSPDLPPAASISLDTAFLRNEKSNVAAITAEDVTVAVDGDDVQRTWYYASGASSANPSAPIAYTDVSAMGGYKKLSFGTDKIVGFDKVGVGKFTTKLDVKEVWTQPTLEEYVTDSDYLTGTTTAASDVQNVAPVVSLELLKSTEQEILLLANNNAEYQTLMNNKTALQQALLTNQIDGQIIIKKLIGNTPGNVTSAALRYSATYPYDFNNPSEGNILAVDSERTYLLTYTWTGSGLGSMASVPKTIHAIDPNSGEVWSYNTNRNENFTFGQDDIGKYLYLVYGSSNQTVLLDKRTGAEAGTINMALSDKIWLSDTLAFIVENKNLYAINLNTLTKTFVAEGVEAVSRVGGNLQFIKKTSSAIVRCILDMETLAVEKNIVIETGTKSSPGNYTALCIDSTGKIVLWKDTGTGTDRFRGSMTITAGNEIATRAAISETGYSAYDLVYALDEQGRCNYIMEREEERSGTDTFYARGFNLNTGAVSYFSSHSTNYALCNYQGAFESNGTAYFMFSGEDTYYGKTGAEFWWNPAYIFQVSGSSCSFGFYGPGFNLMDENMKASDRMAASIDGENKPSAGKLYLRILTYPKTLVQEAAEIISRFTDKLTFVGGMNTTADEIKKTAESAKPVIKISAAQNGYMSLFNPALEEDKKYYYEYEIKPLTDGTKNNLTGIALGTSTATLNQPFLSDTYYVENTHTEDFSDNNTNKFFTFGSPGIWTNHGVFGSNHYDDDTDVGGASLTFTVPAGRKAILSFDYAVLTEGSNDYDAGVYIDGERIYADYAVDETSIWNHHTYWKMLSEGTHTVYCGGAYWYVWIDNLTAEILSTTRPTLNTTLNTQEGNQKGWIDVDGSFETPNRNLSYGSQASTYTTGMISYVVSRYYKNGNPRTSAFTQTVPAGYLQKGFAYPSATTYKSKTSAYYSIADYSYKAMYRSNMPSDGKCYLRTRTPGTYTHTSDADYNAYSSFIPTWELITYPYNEVTATDNIAFDSTFTKYYFPKETSSVTNISMYLPKGEYLIKNLKLYYIEDGQKIYMQNEDCQEQADLSDWTLSAGMTASLVTPEEEKSDDEPIKIYKKGQKVLYNVFYSDYEMDPTKAQYWIYQHLNWPPDSVHPEAGKVLTESIDRFYLSGKYTVTHWQQDNTQRTGTVGDAAPYNKESNRVTMTFYVDGEGKAPWITYIKTKPATVKENNSYSIRVGVDDTEKDPLSLETEVYHNGSLILSDTKTGIAAGADGNYPEQTIGGLPIAQVGVYQVVCTVSDNSGTGLKAYKFTVVSEGRVTGFVNHTDQWDTNRKKYNLKRFSDEVNRILSLSDYCAMSVPRMRGTNVFWSGEKFMLRAEAEGEPTGINVQILAPDLQGNIKSTGYSAALADTGRKTSAGAELWEGSLWNADMINKWGRKNPETLTFRFTADYTGGVTKAHTVTIILDSDRDYWQLHRLW